MSDEITDSNKLMENRNEYNTTVDEKEDEYRFSFNLPGYSESDISVRISEKHLEVEAESIKDYSNEEVHIMQERDFHEKLTVPDDANVNKVSTSYDFGILVVLVAKKD